MQIRIKRRRRRLVSLLNARCLKVNTITSNIKRLFK